MAGRLYVIGTPIGNLADITMRALEKLNQVGTLVCEDSRVTGKLIASYIEKGLMNHKPRLMVCNEYNEPEIAPRIVDLVGQGETVGLVSDAGMPAISDPGFRIIRGCLDHDLPVEVIPGVTALTTAVALSGVGGEYLLYLGFLPKKAGKRTEILTEVSQLLQQIPSLKIVLYISPHKVVKELKEIRQACGNSKAVLLRELTKMFEERIESDIEGLIERFDTKKPKGEMVLVIANDKSDKASAGHRGGLAEA